MSPTDNASSPSPTLPDLLAQLTQLNEQHPNKIHGQTREPWYNDTWMLLTLLLSYIASLGSFLYFFQTHQIVLYGDAYAHMLITRRLFDNITPGLAQLGGVWLPLPHLVMLPFIWNDYLWRTGLAGTFPSMICYIISTHYLFLSMRRLTKNSRASCIGSLLFLLNPNVLYLQTTALTEIVLIATLTTSSYYFLLWAQDDHLLHLVLAAFSCFLATLTRYDGWFLFATFLLLIIPISRLKRHSWRQTEGNLLLFLCLGGLGIALWLLWCKLIFNDPLYFQRGPFSSQAMQKSLINAHVLFTYHDLWQSIRYYTIDCLQNVGPILLLLALLAIPLFLYRQRISSQSLAALVFLAPFFFYVISLYGGQAAIFTPGAVPATMDQQIYNARYGVEVVAPSALFLATLATDLPSGWLSTLGQTLLVCAILLQTFLTATGGIISLQDGQYGVSCARTHAIVIFLAQHYNGGKILEDLYDTKIDALNPEANIDFKAIIYEGSDLFWRQALHQPEKLVDWIIVNQADPHDLVAQNLAPTFNTAFTRDIEEPNGLSLYHRNGLTFPTHPIPMFYLTQHTRCASSQEDSLLSPGHNLAFLHNANRLTALAPRRTQSRHRISWPLWPIWNNEKNI